MNKLKITKKYANEFDKKCAKVDAHRFLRFLTETDAENVSLFDLIVQIGNVIQWKPLKQDRGISLSEQIISNYNKEFFSKYMPQKAKEVEAILNKTHQYFIDKDGVSHVKFIQEKQGDDHSSYVGHSDRNSFLEFRVCFHNSINDLRTTAHELSHAISSHNKHLIELIRSKATKEEFHKYTNKGFCKDCICEIESYITERLFNRFLVKKGIFTSEDLENYENEQEVSLLNEINLIIEERDVLKELPCPVSLESLSRLVENLQNHNNDRLIQRIEKMHNDDKCSPYMFRYVVGRIVAEQWIKNFDRARTKQAKLKMLNYFQDYLDQTYKLDLDSACIKLLKKNFICVVEDFVLDKINERKDEDKITL